MSDQADFSRRALLVLPPLLLLSYVPCAQAGQCVTNGPRYKLESDVVEWRMTIRSSENCILRLQRDGSPDISASVRPGNSRRFRLLIHDQAQFSRRGFICCWHLRIQKQNQWNSTIRVLVSVIGFNEDVRPAFARLTLIDSFRCHVRADRALKALAPCPSAEGCSNDLIECLRQLDR